MLPENELDTGVADLQARPWPRRALALALLLVLLCGIAAAPLAALIIARRQRELAAPTQAAVEASGQIALITPDFQLETLAPPDGALRQLSPAPGRYLFPAWSADGSQLAVMTTSEVWLLAPDEQPAAEPRRVYSNPDDPPIYLYWSPDGRLSFITNHARGIAFHLSDGSGSQALAYGQPFYWDFLPDGSEALLHTGFSGDGAHLALLNLAAAEVGADIAAPGHFQAPGVSPSGNYWAYAQLGAGGDSSLVVRDLNGADVWNQAHLGQVALSWSPAEDLLAFISPPVSSTAFYGPLRLVDPAGDETRVLSDAIVLAFFWSPDGERIAFFTLARPPAGGIQALKNGLRARAGRPVQTPRDELELSLYLVEIANGEVSLAHTFRPGRLFLTQFLPFFDQYGLSHSIWSPSGDQLVISAQPPGEDVARLWLVSSDGRPAAPLVEGQIGIWSPR
ncbi:MAG: TolB family protein [Candidatus Promineifilaceae bacterium]